MQNLSGKHVNDSEFQEFLNREFDKAISNATMEELAEFAFGSVQAAISAYKNNNDS
jgi:hypothetical protein